MAESEGVSTRYLLGAFFAVVLLCAVFFSLGFFLGYREGHPAGTPLTEHVAAPSDAPAAVNSPSNAPSAAELRSAQRSDAQSAQAADSAGDNQAALPETTSPAQSTAAAPATSLSAASATPAQSTEGAGAGGASNSSAASYADESALTPRSVPSGILIQVGAVSSRQAASKIADTLRGRGYPALVLTPAQLGAKDTYFRVIAGPYRTHDAAETALRKLVTEGYRPFIRQ